MGARIPIDIITENSGSLNLLIADFPDLDDTDSWASGLGTTPVSWWFSQTTTPTGAGLGSANTVGLSAALSSGTFTFRTGQLANIGGKFLVLVRK